MDVEKLEKELDRAYDEWGKLFKELLEDELAWLEKMGKEHPDMDVIPEEAEPIEIREKRKTVEELDQKIRSCSKSCGEGARVDVVNEREERTPHGELVEDLLTIVTSFSGRLYGMRSNKTKKVVESVKCAVR